MNKTYSGYMMEMFDVILENILYSILSHLYPTKFGVSLKLKRSLYFKEGTYSASYACFTTL